MAEALLPKRLLKVLVLIIVISQLTNCQQEVTLSPSCAVTNSKIGAMSCCPISEGLPTQSPDEKCVEILPITSASLLPEFWTIEAFNSARQIGKNAKSSVTRSNRTDDLCCCKEKTDFILPDMATTISGSVSQVLQKSPGYVQPVTAKMCKEMRCHLKKNGKREISTCVQLWDATYLFIEDPVYEGFMRRESIKVPSGCNCKTKALDAPSEENINRSFQEPDVEPRGIKTKLRDVVVTTIPAEVEGGSATDDPHEWHAKELQLQNATENAIRPPHASISNVSRPHLTINTTNEQFIDAEIQSVPVQQMPRPSPYYVSSVNTNYERPIDGAIKPQDSINQYPSIYNPSYYSPGNTYRQGPLLNVGNNPQLAFGTLILQDQLKELNSLASSPTFQSMNPQVVNYLNNFNSMLTNYIKMGLLNTNVRAMTTTQIVEHALTKVHSSQQMQTLAMAERLMLLEIEYLRLTMNMMEMSYKQLYSPSTPPKLSFGIDLTKGNVPVAFKPGGLNGGPLHFEIVEPNKTGSSVNTPLSQGTGGTKPLLFGNAPVRAENLTPQVPESKEDSPPLRGKPPPLKIETPKPIKETPSQTVGTTPSRIDPTPPSGENLKVDPLPLNISRVTTSDDTIEEDLYSGFANYIFREAWMNDSCMVPSDINQSQSELYFLPASLKEKFDIKTKGLLNINKFATRIIAGVIKCQFDDVVMALTDGTLARAISGGIKVAQLLSSQIRVMKELMRGILNTDDAKGLVNLLRWTSKSTDGLATPEFISPTDAKDIENLMLVVEASLREYVDYIMIKSIGIGNHSSIMSKPSPVSATSRVLPTMFQLGASMTSTTDRPSIIFTEVPVRIIGIKPQDIPGGITSAPAKPGVNSTVTSMPAMITNSSGMVGVNSLAPMSESKTTTMMGFTTVAGSTIVPTSVSAFRPEFNTLFIIGLNATLTTVTMPRVNATTVSMLGVNSTTITMMETNVTPMSITNTTAMPGPGTITSILTTPMQISSMTSTQTQGSSTNPASKINASSTVSSTMNSTVTAKVNTTVIEGSGPTLTSTQSPNNTFKLLVVPDAHKYSKDEKPLEPPKTEENKYVNEKLQVLTPHPSFYSVTPKPVTEGPDQPDYSEYDAGFGNFEVTERIQEKPDGYKHIEGPGPEDYEGSGDNAPVSGHIVFPKNKQQNQIMSNLPKEYDPLDIAPGSLMNLLFPNLR